MKFFIKISILLLSLVLPLSNYAATKIGVTAALKGEVIRVASADKNTPVGLLKSGSVIYLGDEIKVEKDGRLQVLLLDETVFTLGSGAQMTIDKFVYNPNKGAGELVSNITKGAFRFISGKVAKQNKDAMKVKIPSGIIGVRGTQVAGEIRNDGTSNIILVGPGINSLGVATGAITLTNEQGSVEITRPGYMTSIGANVAPSTPQLASPEQIQEIESQTQENAEVQIAKELNVDSIENVASTDADGDGFPDEIEANTDLGETIAEVSSSEEEGESIIVAVVENIKAETEATTEETTIVETTTAEAEETTTAEAEETTTAEAEETSTEETTTAEAETSTETTTDQSEVVTEEVAVVETTTAESEVVTEVTETTNTVAVDTQAAVNFVNETLSITDDQITTAVAEGTLTDLVGENVVALAREGSLGSLISSIRSNNPFDADYIVDGSTTTDTYEPSASEWLGMELEMGIGGVFDQTVNTSIAEFNSVLTGSSVFKKEGVQVNCYSSTAGCGGAYNVTDTWNFANNTYRTELNTQAGGIRLDTEGSGNLNVELNFAIDKTVDLASQFIIADDSQDAKVHMTQLIDRNMDTVSAGENYGSQTTMWIGDKDAYNHDSAWMNTFTSNTSTTSSPPNNMLVVESVGFIQNENVDGASGNIANIAEHELHIYTTSNTAPGDSSQNEEIAYGYTYGMTPE